MSGGPPIIAVVCSAGGLASLQALLSSLPRALPAAVVVAQHRKPDHESQLARILARCSSLPVREAVHGDELRRGVVLVVPPGRHALVTAGNRLALIAASGPPPSRPSADLLITSLALVAARRSIAVILSGQGNDGATGATALHEFGGTVIVSDEPSSEYFSMPAAAIARDEVVDHVVSLEAMAGVLSARVAEIAARASVEELGA